MTLTPLFASLHTHHYLTSLRERLSNALKLRSEGATFIRLGADAVRFLLKGFQEPLVVVLHDLLLCGPILVVICGG